VHPREPSCTKFYLQSIVDVFFHGLQIYAPLYVVAEILTRKNLPLIDVIKQIIPNILKSTTFLVIQGCGYGAGLCALRALTGNHYRLNYLIPGFISSFAAVSVEKKQRRIELAIYVLNQMLETVFRMLVCRGLLKPFKHGLTLVFAAAMPVLVYFYRYDDSCLGSLKGIMNFLIGTEGKSDRLDQKIKHYLHKLMPFRQSNNSSEEHRTWSYLGALIAFIKCFLIGFFLKQVLQLLRAFKNPSQLGSLLKGNLLSSIRLGLFLGLLSGGIKAIVHLLHTIRGKDDGLNSVIAGFFSAFSVMLFSDTDLVMYCASKALSAIYISLAKRNYVPTIPKGESIAYGVFTMILLYAMCMEPYNLRHSYIMFLRRATADRTTHFEQVGLHLGRELGISGPPPQPLVDLMS